VRAAAGLFEKHKLLLSFQMGIKVLDEEQPLDLELLAFFLKGNLSLDKSPRLKPHAWLPDQGWQDLLRLVELASSRTDAAGAPHPLQRLADDVERNEGEFRQYYELEVGGALHHAVMRWH
jgi:dynein heavy chain, axonemal